MARMRSSKRNSPSGPHTRVTKRESDQRPRKGNERVVNVYQPTQARRLLYDLMRKACIFEDTLQVLLNG